MTRESKQLQTPWRNINSQSTYCISTKDMQKEALSQLQLHAEQQMAVRFARVFEQPAYKHTWPGTESPNVSIIPAGQVSDRKEPHHLHQLVDRKTLAPNWPNNRERSASRAQVLSCLQAAWVMCQHRRAVCRQAGRLTLHIVLYWWEEGNNFVEIEVV